MNTDIFEIVLDSLSHDGRAVGRVDKAVVFVEGALPGQRVRAQYTKRKKNFAEAFCLEVLEQAPDSIAAPCPHGAVCGGCALQTMPEATQKYWKERLITEAMTRIAKLSPEDLRRIDALVPSPKAWNYRNKMEFAFGSDGQGNMTLGLRGKGSHDVHNVPQCRLLPEGCMKVVERVKTLCQEAGFTAWSAQAKGASQVLRHVIVRRPHSPKADGTPQLLITLISAPASREIRLRLTQLGKELMQSCSEVTGFVLEERRSTVMLAQGEHTITSLGDTLLQERLGGVEYTLAHNAFFQINTQAAENLCAQLSAMVANIPSLQEQSPVCLWDVYCGVGAPGLSLARNIKNKDIHLYGVEINQKAIDMAEKNAQKIECVNSHYVASDAKKALHSWPKASLVLVDPPRAGLAPEVVENIKKSQAECILYVSCNPATLARDMALLAEEYKLEKLVPLDFFPQTPHVESCVCLVRR